ncbi:MAG: TldD/PmbA family protein [Candidatus Geothermincolia bacterium]
MRPDFEPLERALESAAALGATDAEAYLERDVGLSIRTLNEKVEKFSLAESRGIGLRVYLGDSQGRAYTSDLSADAIEAAVSSAIESARVTPPEPARALPDTSLYPGGFSDGRYLGEDLEILGDDLERVPASEKIEFAMEMERLAKASDERISNIEASAYSEGTGEISLANTRGFKAAYRASVCYGYIVAIAEQEGESQTGFGFTTGRAFADLEADAAAKEASEMAVSLLGGKPIETGRVSVMIDNLSTAEILAVLGVALSGDSVVKGRSFLAGRIGEALASSRVTIIDDGAMKGGFGTAPFDGEGVAASRKSLVETGKLETFLHDTYTAARMGANTTGNAGRSSYRAQVGVSPTNIFLKPGDASPEELKSTMGTGFQVVELQGVHVGLNPVTGEVSVGARGLWVEKGEPVHAVREVTIAGTIDGILKGIVGVGNDLRFTPLLGGIGTPSILVEGLTVSGT